MFGLTLHWRHPLPWLLLLIGYSLWQQADGWLGLFDGQSWRQMGNFVATSWPPVLIRTFSPLTLTATLESLAVATLGLAGALLLGVPFALLGSRALSLAELGPVPSPLRGALRASRASSPSCCAACPSSSGRCCSCVCRGSDRSPPSWPSPSATAACWPKGLQRDHGERRPLQPARALLLGGSGRLQALWYGVLPAVRQELLSLHRLSLGVRPARLPSSWASSGRAGSASSSNSPCACLPAAGGDPAAGLHPAGDPGGRPQRLAAPQPLPGLLLLICLGLAGVLALYRLDWRMLSFSLDGLGAFVGEFLRPDWSWPFLKAVGTSLLDTVQMALLSTLLSALLALPLACLAATAGRCGCCSTCCDPCPSSSSPACW